MVRSRRTEEDLKESKDRAERYIRNSGFDIGEAKWMKIYTNFGYFRYIMVIHDGVNQISVNLQSDRQWDQIEFEKYGRTRTVQLKDVKDGDYFSWLLQ